MVIFILIPARSSSQTQCPPEGDGGDPALNRLKNRSEFPASYEEMDVHRFQEDLKYIFTPLFRDDFSKDQTQYIEKNEKRGISLVGYILAARLSLPDSTNCHSKTRREIHLYIGGSPSQSNMEPEGLIAQSVVVELTPGGQDLHPAWRLQNLVDLLKSHKKIRVSGWPLYDSLDKNFLGKSRGTLWEIEPVTKIEVWKEGQWRDF